MQLADVTIIIPVYCTTQESLIWLDECIGSAVQQNVPVVVCDDGSPLSITPVTGKYDCRVLFERHGGVSFARNKAIAAADTKLIYPLDCDDRLVPNAIVTLLDMYDGTPLYSDVSKFGELNVAHYVLLDFACSNVYKYVGFSSVNVLHSKEQWETVGGYDEEIDFYEDGEYNARLFLRYCGKRCPRPLVEYRIHKGQRTDTYKAEASKRAKALLAKIGEYDMPCPGCGNRRTTSSFTSSAVASVAPSSIDVNTLPLAMGADVLAQYVGGKGRGKHYYEGLTTKRRYKVSYGDYVYVSPDDTKLPTENGTSLLVRVVRVEAKVAATKPAAVKAETVAKAEAVAPEIVKTTASLPDISNMTVKQITQSDEINASNAAILLKMEEQGLNRSKITAYLASMLS